MKRTLTQDIQNGTIGMKSAKYKGIVQPKEKKFTESQLQTIICKWLRSKNILFISDFAAGLHLSPFLASLRQSQACEYKMPDLYILLPQGLLMIEIKKDVSDLFLKDGKTLKSEHVQLQYENILRLRSLGYVADFGIGEYDIKTMVTQAECGTLEYKEIMQRPAKNNQAADIFFSQFNL